MSSDQQVVGENTIAVRLRVKLHFLGDFTTFSGHPEPVEGTYTCRLEDYLAQHIGMTKFLRQAQDDLLFCLA